MLEPCLGARGLHGQLPSGLPLPPHSSLILEGLLKNSFTNELWLPWVLIAAWIFSSCGERGPISSCRARASQGVEPGLQAHGLSSGAQA